MFDGDDELFGDLDVMLGVEAEAPNQPSNMRQDPRRHKFVCKHWLRGLCKKGDACDFLHRLDHDRMPECWEYTNFGECGSKECIFVHVLPENRATECPWYARGFCKHGTRCRHRHTCKKACPKYLAGFCPEGPECQFGHAKYELPPIPRGEGCGGGRDVGSVTCYRCGQVGHFASRCPQQAKPQQSSSHQAEMAAAHTQRLQMQMAQQLAQRGDMGMGGGMGGSMPTGGGGGGTW